MRNQGGYATLFGAGDQDVGCRDGAYCRGARILDFGMKARMPEDTGYHGPFGNPHAEQRNGRTCQRGLGEQVIGNQLGVWRKRCSALPAARPLAGENMIQLPHQVAQFFWRKICRRQPGLFIGVDIVREAPVRGMRRKRDVRLAVPDEDDAKVQMTFTGCAT